MISRRKFILSSAFLAGTCFALKGFSYIPDKQISLIVITPRVGISYSNAALSHFANKVYPNGDAARRKVPYKGLRFDLRKLPLSIPGTLTKEDVFAGRKDIDLRVKSDMSHLTRIGINTDEFKNYFSNLKDRYTQDT